MKVSDKFIHMQLEDLWLPICQLQSQSSTETAVSGSWHRELQVQFFEMWLVLAVQTARQDKLEPNL